MSTDIKNHSMEERKEMIKSKYQWLGTLYPAMFVEDYKVICMSVKRFFTTIDPIYMGDYKFSESDIIDNSVLFIDEVDAKAINIATYQERIGYITQEPVIFDDTIYNNVTLWSPKTEQNIRKFQTAIENPNLTQLIEKTPEKENMQDGRNGVSLS